MKQAGIHLISDHTQNNHAYNNASVMQISDDKQSETITRKVFHRGDHLFRMGEKLDSLYLVTVGAIRVYTVSEEGEEKVVDFALAGDIIGFDALADGEARASAQALDTTAIVKLPFHDLFDQDPIDPETRRQVFTQLSAQQQKTHELMTQISNQSAKQRVAWFLTQLSKHYDGRCGTPNDFKLPMTRIDIANYLGLAVETISRQLSQLCAEQLIQIHQRQVTVLDPQGLRNCAMTPSQAQITH